jgi:sulfate permease, SulP family
MIWARVAAIRSAAPSMTKSPPSVSAARPASGFPIATALRGVLAKGYGRADLRADVLAGLVVGIVALPLSMALAIAVGAPPQHGLYTAMVAGASVALLGGCRFQVTGPTAAFVVILAPVLNQHGLTGLLTAGLLAGLMLVGLGAARLGTLIQFIPHPVTTGFTAGIATVIATLQIKDLFGLSTGALPDHYTDKLASLWSARQSARLSEFLVAAGTFALLLGVPRLTKKVPAPLIAITLSAALVALLTRVVPGFSVDTIGTRFHSVVDGVSVPGIPAVLPSPAWPFGSELSLALVRELLPAAFAIALLGAIESLLSAVIADGMTGTRHDPNAELVALGIGNILAPIFGGIAATGALARTATNVRTGARSPLAAVTHSVVILLSILLLSPLVAHVPMAALAALLLLVAWNMSELHSFLAVIRVAPKSDVFVLLTCFGLTVIFDMVIAVSVGFVLAAILFMRRMAELTKARLVVESEADPEVALPPGVQLYEINGPLFFGAAQNAIAALHASHRDRRGGVMILHLGRVPVIDSTGLVALENAIATLVRNKQRVVLAGPLPKPRKIFEKARLPEKYPSLCMADDLQAAIRVASELCAPAVQHPSQPSQPLPAAPL